MSAHCDHDESSEEIDEEERQHYFKVVRAFNTYETYMAFWLKRRWDTYHSLDERQKSLVPKLPERLKMVYEATKKNATFLKLLAGDRDPFQNVSFNEAKHEHSNEDHNVCETDHHCNSHEQGDSVLSTEDMEKVKSTLRQFFRDWSNEGQKERDTCFSPIFEELERRFPLNASNDKNYSVLCPGAGLGRLTWEVAKRGYISEGNEWSMYMLIASSFVLNVLEKEKEFTIYPWISTASNNAAPFDCLYSVQVPDVCPNSLPINSQFSMCAGDFVECYKSRTGEFDCIITLFFIDTARNILDYIDVIYSTLKPGGAWINLGPLLYHWENMAEDRSLELSYDELIEVIQSERKFTVENQKHIVTTYAANPRSMMQTIYHCGFFVAVKQAPL